MRRELIDPRAPVRGRAAAGRSGWRLILPGVEGTSGTCTRPGGTADSSHRCTIEEEPKRRPGGDAFGAEQGNRYADVLPGQQFAGLEDRVPPAIRGLASPPTNLLPCTAARFLREHHVRETVAPSHVRV